MAVGLLAVGGVARAELARPVLHCGCGNPTRDKPQSKLWYARGWWWACLPGADGPRVYRRTAPGQWRAEGHLDDVLKSLPGRGDVWADADRAVVALVQGRRLALVVLRWNAPNGRYELAARPRQWKAATPVETITIDRAACGCFWVAYPLSAGKARSIVIRRGDPLLRWPLAEPVVLAEGLGNDEVCAAVALGQAIGVMWSDQKRQALYFRRHGLHAADAIWPATETVAKGSRTADDHINFCRPRARAAPQLLAATKTSLDTNGKPIFSLRVLTADGRWRSTPFGMLTKDDDLTRPIVVWQGERPVSVYTRRNPPRPGVGYGGSFSVTAMQAFTPDALKTEGRPHDIIRAAKPVNNVTGPKRTPDGLPCVVLASDAAGGVYEGIIDTRENR